MACEVPLGGANPNLGPFSIIFTLPNPLLSQNLPSPFLITTLPLLWDLIRFSPLLSYYFHTPRSSPLKPPHSSPHLTWFLPYHLPPTSNQNATYSSPQPVPYTSLPYHISSPYFPSPLQNLTLSSSPPIITTPLFLIVKGKTCHVFRRYRSRSPLVVAHCWLLFLPIQIDAKKAIKWLKPWHTGTTLRVLSKGYPRNTNLIGFRCLWKGLRK